MESVEQAESIELNCSITVEHHPSRVCVEENRRGPPIGVAAQPHVPQSNFTDLFQQCQRVRWARVGNSFDVHVNYAQQQRVVDRHVDVDGGEHGSRVRDTGLWIPAWGLDESCGQGILSCKY